jgi:hypothetical protein
MDYWTFKQQGYPIGLDVIEGAANSVIAARMRRSGMRWSFSGINRTATLRAEFASAQPILDFHKIPRLLGSRHEKEEKAKMARCPDHAIF